MRKPLAAFALALSLALPLAPARAQPSLAGTWSTVVDGQPLTVTFAPDGTGKVNGQPMRWQAMGSMLLVEQNGEVASYQYQVQDGKLGVAGGAFAGVVVFTRGTAAAARAKQAKGAKTASASGDGRELAGKWCHVSTFSANAGGGSSRMTCFELRPDGSYTYQHEGSMSANAPGMWGGTASQSSDAGRWSVSGDRITARSQGGAVRTYRLEKRNHPKNRDPMICLDGDCYVTYWRKAPW